ncbi:hypothetical protein [Aquisalibacillus elongatus]|uniref:Uncharacterized protein n=1 Tax=Aquisalibacillus elongatus TaxID=485577 RepID=A0A3N5AZ68_9BACI|nr:hypothetical protein [Aquisalibacillus elongatus]RPF50566.1 hypothetical protein EDC24_2533 [Aquisalibacillus elongatus]
MKKLRTNENGAALVVVLLTIALIMLFSTVMLDSILSNAKQTDIAEHHDRATHIAEMGVEFVEQEMAMYVDENGFELDADYLNNLTEYLKRQINNVTIDENHSGRYFELDLEEGESIEPQDPLKLSITGHDDNFSETITVQFGVSSGIPPVDEWDDEEFPSPPESPDQHYEGNQEWDHKNCPEDSNDTYYVEGGADFKNCNLETGDFYSTSQITTENKGSLLVKGTGVFTGVDINNQSKVTIYENAYIGSQLTSYNNPESEFLVCGNAKFDQGIEYRGDFKVRGHVVSDQLVRYENNTAYIGQDAIFKDGLDLKNSDLYVGGDLTIKTSHDKEGFENNLGGNFYVSGDFSLETPYDDEPVTVNPDGDLIHDLSEAPQFPECEDAPPLSSTGDSGLDVSIGDSEY